MNPEILPINGHNLSDDDRASAMAALLANQDVRQGSAALPGRKEAAGRARGREMTRRLHTHGVEVRYRQF